MGQELSGKLSYNKPVNIPGTYSNRTDTLHGTGGATILLTGPRWLWSTAEQSVKTDSSGNYHMLITVHSGKSYTVRAYYFYEILIPKAYDLYTWAWATTTTINIKEKNGGRFTPG
jgi:hypothetical protein